MTLSAPIQSFGIHQVTFRDLLDPSIMGTAKVVGDVTPDLVQELVESRGGSATLAWGIAPGEASGEISMILKQYDKNVLRFINPWISGSQVENTSGDSGGNTSTLTNKVGTSFQDATSGIASIAVDATTKDELAYGNYVAKATAVGTFDLYLDTDVSGLAPYVDDSLKITTAPITNPGTTGTVVYKGIEFTAGSGASSFTTGDMATFSVRPVNTYNLTSYLFKDGATLKEFKLTIIGEKVGDRIRRTVYPRCIASGGLNLKYMYKNYAEAELTVKILQPSDVDYVGIEEFVNR